MKKKRNIRSIAPIIVWFNKGCFGFDLLRIVFSYKKIYNPKNSCISLFSFSFITSSYTRNINFSIWKKQWSYSFLKKVNNQEEIDWIF